MHKKLKKVIHPNRYLIWAIIYCLTVGGLLIGFIFINSLNLDSESVSSDLKTHKVFVNQNDGYSLRYPASWIIEWDNSGNPVFENPKDNQESLTVSTGSLDVEGIIRHSISIISERNSARGDLKISVIKALGSKGDGEELDIAIIKNSKKLFYISGHSDALNVFVKNFKAE